MIIKYSLKKPYESSSILAKFLQKQSYQASDKGSISGHTFGNKI